jgi:hypothetical protein
MMTIRNISLTVLTVVAMAVAVTLIMTSAPGVASADSPWDRSGHLTAHDSPWD